MISIITPTHDTKYLEETLDSLKAQTYQGDIEWLISPNNGAVLPWTVTAQDFVRIVPSVNGTKIGALKRHVCDKARGEIVVELDHDDILTPNALSEIADTFEDGAVDFAYSDFAEFHQKDGRPNLYGPAHGWTTKPYKMDGHQYIAHNAWEPTPAAMRSVHYAPNHVRAWRRSTYERIGGHDPEMAICDDHDLCCRFYLEGKMEHIDECLYLYRIHGQNNWLKRNGAIQETTKEVRDKYIWKLAERWCDLNGLTKVDLGSAHNKPDGYLGVDMAPGQGVDIVHDVRKGLPFDDGRVGLIRAFDFLEHIQDSVFMMNEIYRVLVDGGWLLSLTPSTDGRGAFQDPTHCAYWNANSFWYYTDREYAKYVPEIETRFQVMRIKSAFPSPFHRNNAIPYVYADLMAVKSDERRPGLLKI